LEAFGVPVAVVARELNIEASEAAREERERL